VSEAAVADAFLAALREEPTLRQVVHEGTVLERPTRYVSVFTDGGLRGIESFTGPQQTVLRTFVVHSVAADPEKVRQLGQLVVAQVVDRVLVVDGRVCRRVQHEASEPARLDRDVDPPLFYGVDEFSVTSKPAT